MSMGDYATAVIVRQALAKGETTVRLWKDLQRTRPTEEIFRAPMKAPIGGCGCLPRPRAPIVYVEKPQWEWQEYRVYADYDAAEIWGLLVLPCKHMGSPVATYELARIMTAYPLVKSEPARVAKRIGWQDSCRMPSRIHKTFDNGETTVCGHFPRRAMTAEKTERYGKEEPRWVLDPEVPRKIRGSSRYCKECFADGDKSAPFVTE